MSETKFTREWEVWTDDEMDETKLLGSSAIESPGYYKTADEFTCESTSELAHANANLFAQSPAMYEFIHRLIDNSMLDIGWREEAEELLAAARGEQS